MTRSKFGRQFIYWLYGGVVVYLSYVVVGGMALSLYEQLPPPGNSQPAEAVYSPCMRRLVVLHSDLESFFDTSVRRVASGESPATVRAGWERWEATYFQPLLTEASASCTGEAGAPLKTAYDALEELVTSHRQTLLDPLLQQRTRSGELKQLIESIVRSPAGAVASAQ